MPATTLFAARTDANKITLAAEKTFGEFLTTHSLEAKLDDVALYNWGTKQPREINRMLVERLGCTKVDDDPLKSALDPAFALVKSIHKPEPWKPEQPLEVGKTHQIKVRQRFPVPAVSIAKLTRWFKPDTEACEIEYLLEGVASRAKDVDVEVHPSRYYKDDKGTEKPSDTHADAGSRRLMQKRGAYKLATVRVPADAQKFAEWKGKSDATEGVLKNAFINAGCAPYNVHLRYYKDSKDENARVLLKPFYPRWKPGTTDTLLEPSMVVTWDILDDNKKLKGGQLVIWDKDGKVVFFAALDETRLQTDKKYDLLKDAVKKWDAKDVKQDAMPYRAQLQAHSDEFEGDGLAIAVMPTQVRAFQYTKVQFVALNTRPGYVLNKPDEYLGDTDDATDIEARCKEMKAAIAKALPQCDASENVLKVFMAPEFFFRGANGAYAIENVTLIRHFMAPEIEKVDYADWLFVYGSVIGMLPHEDDSAAGKIPRVHAGHAATEAKVLEVVATDELKLECAKEPKVGWVVLDTVIERVQPNGSAWSVDLARDVVVAPNAKVELQNHVVTIFEAVDNRPATNDFTLSVFSSLGDRIYTGKNPALNWQISQNMNANPSQITKVSKLNLYENYYELLVTPPSAWDRFEVGPATLEEPQTTEVFNLALVQKGWPALLAGEHDVKAAVVYKEYISSIDYVVHDRDNFDRPGGSGRKILLDGRWVMVLPTLGSSDLLGANPTRLAGKWKDKGGLEHSIGSEVSATGIGGGIVFTVDGVTFGLEVCLDHLLDRLSGFYTKNAVKGVDPYPQVHLIPSWGMKIGRGGNLPPNAASPPLTFNVDGASLASTARKNDGKYSCDDHPAHIAAASGTCPEIVEVAYCGTCDTLDKTAGKCRTCKNALSARRQCVKIYSCWVCPTCGSETKVAGDCPVDLVPREERHYCTKYLFRYYCNGCNQFLLKNNCVPHGPTGTGLFKCLRTAFYFCLACKQPTDTAGNCSKGCGAVVLFYRCKAHSKFYRSGNTCPDCSKDPRDPCGIYQATGHCKHVKSRPERCGYYIPGNACRQPAPSPEGCYEYYDAAGACPKGDTTPKVCGKALTQTGTNIAPTFANDPLALPDTHFEKAGYLTIYPATDLPPPSVVPP